VTRVPLGSIHARPLVEAHGHPPPVIPMLLQHRFEIPATCGSIAATLGWKAAAHPSGRLPGYAFADAGSPWTRTRVRRLFGSRSARLDARSHVSAGRRRRLKARLCRSVPDGDPVAAGAADASNENRPNDQRRDPRPCVRPRPTSRSTTNWSRDRSDPPPGDRIRRTPTRNLNDPPSTHDSARPTLATRNTASIAISAAPRTVGHAAENLESSSWPVRLGSPVRKPGRSVSSKRWLRSAALLLMGEFDDERS
jgi:hypothetical protein